MKALNKFWYKPPHQPFTGKPPVEFELLPLDQRTWLYLKGEFKGKSAKIMLSPEAYLEAFRYAVTNWRGPIDAFSEEAKEEMLYGAANNNVSLWQAQIAGELVRRVVFPEAEVKNS